MRATYVLRLLEDALAPGAPAVTHAAPCNRAFYAVEGSARLDGRDLAADQALRAAGAVTATAPDGARLWRFELLPAPAPDDGRLDGPGLRSEIKLAVETALPASDEGYLMRCDRVDFVPGVATPKHTHAGPGIRCLLAGAIDAEIGPHRAVYRAGEAWFEPGPLPVVGRPTAREPSAFVRLMVLPRALLGQPSFRYWSDEDRRIPRPQSFRLFFDQPIAL